MTDPKRIIDDLESIIFEGNTCRQWLSSLAKRMKYVELLARNDETIPTDYPAEMKEVVSAQRALEKAMNDLEPFRKMAHRRETVDDALVD